MNTATQDTASDATGVNGATDDATYVIVASEHNGPALESCLDSGCQRVIIIATHQTAKAASRVQSMLQGKVAEVQVIGGMGGEDVAECQRWIEHTLHPLLAGLGGPVYLNLNGGTKTMGLLIATCWPWKTIDYQAYSPTKPTPLQRFTLGIQASPHAGHQRTVVTSHTESPRSAPLLPIDLLQIYCDKPVKATTPNHAPQGQNLAREMFAAHQTSPDNARPDHPWWAIEKACGKHWFGSRKAERSKPLAFADLSQNPDQGGCTQEQLRSWMDHTSAALGSDFWQHNDTHFSLPPADDKGARWLRGDWLEQWAHDVLQAYQQTQPDGQKLQFQVNVEAIAGATNDREIDVISRYGHSNLHVLELKVEAPHGDAVKTIMDRLETLEKQAGKCELGLGVSPIFFKKLSTDALKDFQTKCQDKGIKLIELTGPQSLLDWVAPAKKI